MTSVERLYLSQQGTRQKWLQICNEHRQANNLSPETSKSVRLVYSIGFALKKCEVDFPTWQTALKKFRSAEDGEDAFLMICQAENLHVKANNGNKIKIIRRVLSAVNMLKPSTKKDPVQIKRSPSRKPQRKEPVQNEANVHRSVQKNMLIPYITSLYRLKILNSDEHSPEDLLSDAVLDLTATTCHRHWTSSTSSRVG